ncbi:anthranilate synthase component I family protein [Leucobacter komagatae]|uniref:anthranilate synthase component I family protein n=1 Tax=Leucobacter komagatae TaxID=55969 RepID=UPI001FEA8BE6|nr:anthranilate synthase component I family protein [Leucobacter komagatae]
MEHGGVSEAAALAGQLTAAGAAAALSTAGSAWFWLDGEAAAAGEPRVSYLGIASEVREAARGDERAFLEGLRAHGGPRSGTGAGSHSDAEPVGFGSGWVVALGYEFGVALLGVEPQPDSAAPAFALRAEAVLAIHHGTGEARFSGDPSVAARLRDLVLRGAASTDRGPEEPRSANHNAPRWRRQDYDAQVEQCRSAIRNGDAYVLCLTDTAEGATTAAPLDLYLQLRGGALRGGVIVTGDRALVSASPERFLSVRAGRVSTHPIKGTRPRGADAALDRALAEELGSDPKERAENLMIVDLMRNDLARVCEPGSVRVERFLAVESHPRVHQLVSTVSGALADGMDAVDAIAACFPGGSMTGAPKRSAVEILAGLEVGPRGLYSGCFGWLGDSGAAELAMMIRGIELRGAGLLRGREQSDQERQALVGAGGGITIDSDPADEVRERDLKGAAMLAIL